jgi:hypothetical protein
MEITEKKIRQITAEAQKQLGAHANPAMIKKVVTEVVRRLTAESATASPSTKY